MGPNRKQLLIFFQDAELTRSLTDALTNDFEVQKVGVRDTLIPLVRQAKPAVVVFSKRELDMQMLSQLVNIRDTGMPIGLIALASTYNFNEEKEAFLKGVDHYLLAATPTQSLTVRIVSLARKILRERALVQGNLSILPRHEDVIVTELAGQSITIGSQGLNLNGQHVDLPHIQLELLKLFLKNEGKLFSREDLVRLVWRGEEISMRSVDAQISKLKTKLQFLKDHLRNHYGSGYSLERYSSKKSA